MTSLAQQLQRLALPQSDPSLLSRDEVVSLLFDPKEAATIDRDTAFAIGKLPFNLESSSKRLFLDAAVLFSLLTCPLFLAVSNLLTWVVKGK